MANANQPPRSVTGRRHLCLQLAYSLLLAFLASLVAATHAAALLPSPQPSEEPTTSATLHAGQEQSRDSYLQRANRALQDGDYLQARTLVAEGLQQFPGDAALDALASLTRVQADEERRRLVERGLETFFENPGVSCRAWMRLLQIEPDDENATRNVEALSRRLETELDQLERAAEDSIQARDWAGAMRYASELGELECLYKRSTPLIARIDASYRDALVADLDLLIQQVQRGECASHRKRLDLMAGETLLSRQQTAKAYLLIATCEYRAEEVEKARNSLNNALSFDPELKAPDWLDSEVQTLLRAIRITP